MKLADAIERDAESFATLEALNCGKPRIRVLQDELPAIVDCFRFFAGAVRNMHGPVAGEYLAGYTSMIYQDFDKAGQKAYLLGATYDFAGLEYMNSGGIGLLVTLLVRAQRAGQRLMAVGLSDHYRQILSLTRLDEAIEIHDDEAAALAAVTA